MVKYRTTTGLLLLIFLIGVKSCVPGADVHLPFTIKPMLQEYGNVMDMTVNIKGEFESKYLATAVVVTIPIPTSASKVTVQAKNGKAKYKAGANNVVWK